jgi:uncharacterized protein YggU (UPF0235/DUF167 family)
MSAFASHPDGTVVSVLVVPSASATEVTGLHGDAVRIRVTAAAEGGKANAAVGRLLCDLTGARSADLVAGARSRRKRFLLAGVTPAAARATLAL